DEGVIGAVRLIRSSHSFTIDHPNDARLLTAMEGGSLMDVGCYCVNFSRFLAGEPERVYAEQAVNHEGVDLRFGGTMRFPGDVLAQFDSGLDVPDRKQVEVVGEEGSIDVNDPWHCQEPLLKLRRRGEIERIVSEPLDAYRLELEDFAAAVRGERVPRLGRKDAVAQAAAIEALYRSADRGEPVELFGTRLGEG
ncbi:MAG: Gfo/Idh/MocA family protein, partial [Gemmatimonadaceae bacterium]